MKYIMIYIIFCTRSLYKRPKNSKQEYKKILKRICVETFMWCINFKYSLKKYDRKPQKDKVGVLNIDTF